MVFSRGGLRWQAARARIPHTKAMVNFATRPRSLVFALLAGIVLLLYSGIWGAGSGPSCWGPSKSPIDMSPNEYALWHARQRTPVIFNPHKPIEVDSKSIQYVDMNPIKSTRNAVINEERILILTPLKDAAPYLSKYFELLTELTYPHRLIDLAFLVSDSTDETLAILASEVDRIQKRSDHIPFNSVLIVEKDFHFYLSQDVEERHSFAAQGPRRKALGKARNYLLSAALKPEHSWVYWRDVDIVESSEKILEDFISHDTDIIVPNTKTGLILRAAVSTLIPRMAMADNVNICVNVVDYNSWVESDQGRQLTESLDKDVVLAEGYAEYQTGRTYMALMGDWRSNPNEELELDGIGGVSILVKADVHRSGINFPCYAFENQAETEGFARMAKRAGYKVIGLPNYVVWHIDTEEKPGNV
ncbi:Mannan polymerase II complex subunit-like protein [Hapsidospora chrysogenum ATCC 11550]|uniref:Mannan polymerase II complex subunit-like protein n=1 Tax=Hapsidospora chrysogenum (strain ATCC 11550 / CBS 779.69 / DSM 880 / IAM 14645 / JCM 23072 / IMI 49137) TaxID=857340 RepID=A0A086T788_HAPC1|nr:Mannan polymerase II complex subunit-like protein [Hapsidospora chrysogenum ATCC 11550]